MTQRDHVLDVSPRTRPSRPASPPRPKSRAWAKSSTSTRTNTRNRSAKRRNTCHFLKTSSQPTIFPNPNVFAKQQGRKSDVSRPTGSDLGPSLSQIKRFTSGRDSLAGFDWMAQIAPAEGDQGNYYSDEDSDGEEEVIVPFSAPILVGVDLEPKKEINLWNRRTVTQPRPLRVNTL
ncbi:hypothetical protein Acr_00g0043370 [Actinidia rufa]|uniref:Uncharacterized protein n=1 Tax=Actinidia rufa TaxID=165716 RepID=A0A7J0DIS8_9ERIC|nr:hypothetical protein Acr_00g0043370 [Actinidia rufa]